MLRSPWSLAVSAWEGPITHLEPDMITQTDGPRPWAHPHPPMPLEVSMPGPPVTACPIEKGFWELPAQTSISRPARVSRSTGTVASPHAPGGTLLDDQPRIVMPGPLQGSGRDEGDDRTGEDHHCQRPELRLVSHRPAGPCDRAPQLQCNAIPSCHGRPAIRLVHRPGRLVLLLYLERPRSSPYSFVMS